MIIDFRFLGQNGGSTSGGGMTSGDVQSIVESYNYVDSGEVETQITEKGYVNQNALIDEFYSAVGEDLLHAGGVQSVLETAGIIVANSEESDLTINVLPTATSDLTNDSGYITSADTQNFLTSADTQNFVGTADFEEATEVISTALNDLNTRMSNIPSGSTNNAPIFINSADTTNKANDIWDAIMNEGYIPDIWLAISIAGDLTHVKLNAFETSMVDGEIDLYFQWGNTMYKWSLLYDNQTGHAAFDSFNTNQFGVNTNGSILGVRKVAQTAYNELVASGETDETTAYYVVPDDPCSGYTQEECDCINSGGTWVSGQCYNPIVISAQTDAMSSSYSLPLTGVSAVTDANFDFTNVATIADGDYPDKPACKISNDSNGSRSSVKVVNITTSSVTYFDYAFNEMEELVSLSFDLTNATTAQNLYYRCPKLSSLTITFGDNPSVPSELNAGLENGNCPALTNVQINGTFPMCDIKLFASEYPGDKCSGLTSNSIDSIIAALPSGASDVTIYFGETVYNNMTQSQKNAIEDKGWNVSVQEASCDDAENPDECYCQEDGGTWVEGEGESDAHCVYPCDDAENYDQCMCEEQGGNWVMDDSENEVGHCEGLESSEP